MLIVFKQHVVNTESTQSILVLKNPIKKPQLSVLKLRELSAEETLLNAGNFTRFECNSFSIIQRCAMACGLSRGG